VQERGRGLEDGGVVGAAVVDVRQVDLLALDGADVVGPRGELPRGVAGRRGNPSKRTAAFPRAATTIRSGTGSPAAASPSRIARTASGLTVSRRVIRLVLRVEYRLRGMMSSTKTAGAIAAGTQEWSFAAVRAPRSSASTRTSSQVAHTRRFQARMRRRSSRPRVRPGDGGAVGEMG
jgi:hypothetical protein